MMLSDRMDVKIADIVPFEYQDFVSFCNAAGKVFASDVTEEDYASYRVRFGYSQNKVKKLQNIIDKGKRIYKRKKVATTPSDLSSEGLYAFEKSKHSNQNVKKISATSSTSLSQQEKLTENIKNSDELFDKNSNATYAELLGVNVDDFEKISITKELFNGCPGNVRIRFCNSMKRMGCSTLKDMFLLTPQAIHGTRNIGPKFIHEIEKTIIKIAIYGVVTNVPDTVCSVRPVTIRDITWNILHDVPYSVSELNDSEIAYADKVVQAKETLGTDLCLEFANSDEAKIIAAIANGLHKFCVEYDMRYAAIQSANEAVRDWDSSILSLDLKPFIDLYGKTRVYPVANKFQSLITSNYTVGQYAEMVESQSDTLGCDIEIISKELNCFQKWMTGVNLSLLVKKLLFDTKGKPKINSRHFEILRQRSMGLTFEEIAQKNGITRERVRQITTRATHVIATEMDPEYNILALVSAYRNGDNILQKHELIEILGEEFGQILWYCASQKASSVTELNDGNSKTFALNRCLLDSDLCHYDSESNTINVSFTQRNYNTAKACADEAKRKVYGFVNTLPELIETPKLQQLLEDAAAEESLPLELYSIAANDVYKQAGVYSYKGRLTVARKFDHILKMHFHNGYKIKEDAAQFAEYLEKYFGNQNRMSCKTMDTKIMSVGVLVDRGKYVHSDCVDVDRAVVEKVFAYIAKSHKSALTYSELYEHFKNKFTGTIITNRFALQGVMKFYGCPFYSHRDYVSKKSGANITAEFNRFIKSGGTATKAEILAEFPGWKDHNIIFILPRCPEVIYIGDSTYIHCRLLDIREEDRVKIKRYLDANISDIPVSSRFLQNKFTSLFSDFLIRNDIQSHNKLFGILQYMYSQDYCFSRPYISKEYVGEITSKGVLLQHIGDTTSIDVDDLIDLAGQNAVKYLGVTVLVESLQPEFIRINRTTLMRYENIGLSEDILGDILDILNESISSSGGYIAAAAVADFTSFPVLNVPWTPFLLESVANLLDPGVHNIKMITPNANIPNSIYVDDEYADEDWYSLILRLIKERHALEPFSTKTEVLKWLQSKSLCNKTYPAFLDAENHLFYDSEGKLKIE